MKQEIENILTEETKERSSKYFLNLEKRNYKNKNITKLVDSSGVVITDLTLILNEEKNFFQKLFKSSSPPDIETENMKQIFFKNDDIPKLSDRDRDMCEGPLTLAECSQALKAMKNGKTPGTDGFGSDMYTFFWQDIKYLVHDSINYAYEHGHLSIDQRRGIITLTPKHGKDRTHLKNWRPISLLNTDYKIMAKAIAARIKQKLPLIIHTDQTGFIKGRYIGENCRLMADILHMADQKQISGFMLLIDFQKAYDSVEWKYIDKILPLYNIGTSFQKWVKLLYYNSESTVINNGFATEFFQLERSVRQGCPLAAFIFLLVVEILAIAIRKTENIQGIMLRTGELKISQFADDTTCFLMNEMSVKNIMSLFTQFYKCSGLKCNVDKTEMISLNKRWNPEHGELPVIDNHDVFKCLGITFHMKEIDTSHFNMNTKYDAFSKVLRIWQTRDLSIIGRNTILKSLAVSKLIYPATSLYVPPLIIANIQKDIINYIWNQKPAKVKRNVMHQQIERGGLKVTDFKLQCTSLKLRWISRILDPTNKSAFKKTLQQMIPDIDIMDIFSTRCNYNFDRYHLPEFYRQLLQDWNNFRTFYPPTNKHEIINEYLWMNDHITVGKKPMFLLKFHRAGIKQIKHLVTENGEFRTLDDLTRSYNVAITFLEYYQIRTAIPLKWRRTILSDNPINLMQNTPMTLKFKMNDMLIPINDISSSDFYQMMLRKVYTEKPIVNDKWEQLLNVTINFAEVYTLSQKIIRPTIIQAFHFSFLHQYVPHNYKLKCMKLIETSKCNHCD